MADKRDEEDVEVYRRRQAEMMLRLFEDAHNRPARTVDELEEWVASDEGRRALAYDQTPDGKIIPE
jgi:hypothetical protein